VERSRLTKLENVVQLGQMTILKSLKSLQSRARRRRKDKSVEIDHASESSESEAFYSCQSELSSKSSVQLNMTFERLSTFYPEKYTVDARIQSDVFVFAKQRARYAGVVTDLYWLHVAESARRWRRLSFFAINSGLLETSLSQIIPYGRNERVIEIPRSAAQLLRETIQHADLDESITSSRSGNITATRTFSNKAAIFPHDVYLSTYRGIKEMFEDLGCPQYLESELIVIGRSSPSRLNVLVEGRRMHHNMLPFGHFDASADSDGLDILVRQLRACYLLRDRQTLLPLEGIVVDDQRQQLKGYLVCITDRPSLSDLLSSASHIPWPQREQWARQVVSIIADLHSQGCALGVVTETAFVLDYKGKLVFRGFFNYPLTMVNRNGEVPPEIRGDVALHEQLLHLMPTPEADIFQLGLLLWIIANNCRGIVNRYFCESVCCRTVPFSHCRADHTNPVSLPPCWDAAVPPYFQGLISMCRHTKPSRRPTASALLSAFPTQETSEAQVAFFAAGNLPMRINACRTWCNECGRFLLEGYRCDACDDAQFDLCLQCHSRGIRCLDSDHIMTRCEIVTFMRCNEVQGGG